jgi:hypothetical protein
MLDNQGGVNFSAKMSSQAIVIAKVVDYQSKNAADGDDPHQRTYWQIFFLFTSSKSVHNWFCTGKKLTVNGR